MKSTLFVSASCLYPYSLNSESLVMNKGKLFAWFCVRQVFLQNLSILWSLSTQSGHTIRQQQYQCQMHRTMCICECQLGFLLLIHEAQGFLALLLSIVFIVVWPNHLQSCCFSFSQLLVQGQIWGCLWSLYCIIFHCNWRYWFNTQFRPTLITLSSTFL